MATDRDGSHDGAPRVRRIVADRHEATFQSLGMELKRNLERAREVTASLSTDPHEAPEPPRPTPAARPRVRSTIPTAPSMSGDVSPEPARAVTTDTAAREPEAAREAIAPIRTTSEATHATDRDVPRRPEDVEDLGPEVVTHAASSSALQRPRRPRTRPQLVTATPPQVIPVDTSPTSDATAAIGTVDPVVVEPSAFGAAPWWSRDWWRIPAGRLSGDVTCDAGTVGELAAIGTSLRGHKHRLDAAANDDAFVLRWADDRHGTRWLIACVCDGVGSAPRSAEGARFVAEHFCSAVSALIASDEWDARAIDRASLDAIAADITATAQALLPSDGHPLEDFETTMTFVAVEASPPVGAARRSTFGWVGDSPAFVLRSGDWCPIDPAATDDGPAAIMSTRTNGFFSSPSLDRVLDVPLMPDEVVLLSSDGIGSFLSDGTRTLRVGSVLADALARPVDVLRAVNLLSFDMRSADDDRTAVIVWQRADSVDDRPGTTNEPSAGTHHTELASDPSKTLDPNDGDEGDQTDGA